MDFKVLDYFMHVKNAGSFSKAAREAFISPQGLTKAIHLLEQELSVTLFLKTATGLELTPHGERFALFADRVLREYQVMSQDMEYLSFGSQRSLRLGFVTGSIIIFDLSFMDEFRKRYPKIVFSYDNRAEYLMDQDLKKGLFDIAVTKLPVTDEEICSVPLTEIPLYFAVNQNNILANKKCIEVSDLREQAIISVGPSFKGHYQFIDLCRENGFEPKFTLITEEKPTIQMCIENDMGISLCMPFERSFFLSERLVLVPFSGMNAEFGISHLKSHVLTEEEQYLIELIRGSVRNFSSAK